MAVSKRVAASVLEILPRKQISRALGRLTRVERPGALVRAAVRVFCKAYDVNLEEAEVPSEGFASFDAFFTRKLQAGARPLPVQDDCLVSPADGRVEDMGEVGPGQEFLVKGQTYSLGELLGDAGLAAQLQGGQFFIVYLSPRDYHRVHAPVHGRVVSARHIDGTLYPVNAIGLEHVPRVFARNERVVSVQVTDGHGPVVTVMVGAIGVGHISMSYDERILTNAGGEPRQYFYGTDGPTLERGGELGTFHMGSTAIVFVPAGMSTGPLVEAGATVRVGSAMLGIAASLPTESQSVAGDNAPAVAAVTDTGAAGRDPSGGN